MYNIKIKKYYLSNYLVRVRRKQFKSGLSVNWPIFKLHFFLGEIFLLCVTNIIKMKRNRSLNTTNGLLAKMESSYVTTCFGLFLWPSSGYNLVENIC